MRPRISFAGLSLTKRGDTGFASDLAPINSCCQASRVASRIRIDVNEQRKSHDSHGRKSEDYCKAGSSTQRENPLVATPIFGESINSSKPCWFQCQVGCRGTIRTERWNDDMLLLVHNADRNLATTLRIGPNTSTVDVTLDEAATVRKPLVGSDGQPIPAGAGMLTVSGVKATHAAGSFYRSLSPQEDASYFPESLREAPATFRSRSATASSRRMRVSTWRKPTPHNPAFG